MFGERLILECGEVTLTLPEATRRQKLEEFINRVAFTYRNNNLSHFISENFNSFFENKVTVNYGNIQIPLGMKLIKAFKYYEENEEMLRKIQDEASMIIQEDKINGILCLSIHPLDFMSLSENTYNWRSCHALDGEYCAGNLSYMGDAATIICYIKGKEDAVLPNFNFKWNSKKWRMLLHFSEKRDMMFAGRHYPFVAPEIFNRINYVLYDYFNINMDFYTDWDNYMINDMRLADKYICINRQLYPLWEIIKDKSKLHYNDLLYSTCYQPYYSYLWSVVGRRGYDSFGNITEEAYIPKFYIGHEVKCLECGETHIGCGEGVFVCDGCRTDYSDDMYICECCGRRHYYDEMTWVNDSDACICDDCLETEAFKCEVCKTYWFNSEAQYDEINNEYYCPHCMEAIENGRKNKGE